MAKAKYIPAGWPALIPRIAVDDPEALVAFIQHVFGATGSFNPARPSELRIDESLLMVGSTIGRKAMPAFLYVYVEDADAVYRDHDFARPDWYFIRRKWDYFVEHLLGTKPPSDYAIAAPPAEQWRDALQ